MEYINNLSVTNIKKEKKLESKRKEAMLREVEGLEFKPELNDKKNL